MANSAYWTTAREFTRDAVLAVSNTRKFEQWHIPEYTYEIDERGYKRVRPRCEDLEIVVKTGHAAQDGRD